MTAFTLEICKHQTAQIDYTQMHKCNKVRVPNTTQTNGLHSPLLWWRGGSRQHRGVPWGTALPSAGPPSRSYPSHGTPRTWSYVCEYNKIYTCIKHKALLERLKHSRHQKMNYMYYTVGKSSHTHSLAPSVPSPPPIHTDQNNIELCYVIETT